MADNYSLFDLGGTPAPAGVSPDEMSLSRFLADRASDGYYANGASQAQAAKNALTEAAVSGPPGTLPNAIANAGWGGLYGLATGVQNVVANSEYAPTVKSYSTDAPTPEDRRVDGSTRLALDLMGAGYGAGAPVSAGEFAVGAGPIRAYHGSPHDFDRFDLSKIGTGEGAQAYGHGLYFAEKEGVARNYRDGLSQPTVSHPTYGENLSQQNVEFGLKPAIRKAGGDEASIDRIARQVAAGVMEGDDLSHMQSFVRSSDWSMAEKSAWNAALEKAKEYKVAPNPGRMYEVQINADPEHFLDWDRPLSEQHPKVQEAFKRDGIGADYLSSGSSPGWGDLPAASLTGEEAHRILAGRYQSEYPGATKGYMPPPGYNAQAEATQALREAGVPGIKYLDAGSRSAGEGSRNYVVFDDKLIDILKKYGLAGLGLGLGAAALPDGSGQQ